MEIIEKLSPNQSLRKSVKIDMIVIHATAGASLENAVSWMQNPKSGVSAHYCIGKDGKIVKLVDESKKAWHAGKSSFMYHGKVEENLNENSIGIEIVNLNNGKDEYPEIQIKTVAQLVHNIMLFYDDITTDRIVGHWQITPIFDKLGNIQNFRKTDPGILFPWVRFGELLAKLQSKGA